MYRIRFHGRGGEGMKTASRILGTSFFLEGFEVQDAPRYGAERRGAPVFAYVRASKHVINERGVIHKPDLIVIADDSLISVIPETLFEGTDEKTVTLIISENTIKELKIPLRQKENIITLSIKDRIQNYRSNLSTICASAAAGLLGVINIKNLEQGITEELGELGSSQLSANIDIARFLFKEMEPYNCPVGESEDVSGEFPVTADWITLSLEQSGISTPSIRKTATSIKNRTGLWRTERPIINRELCSRCMLCNIYCPENVINNDSESYPEIDYEHCKGCLICAEICPSHAIEKTDENLSISEDG